MKKKFHCEVDCANCAAKIEEAIKQADGVIGARINFLTQKFTLEAEDSVYDSVLEEAIRIGKRVEPEFRVEM